MKRISTITVGVILFIALAFATTACGPSKADVAAKNLSTAAENFEIARHIVGINGITDKYLWEVVGYCSVETTTSSLGGSLQTTCKVVKDGEARYTKTYLGLSDNVTFVVTQVNPAKVSTQHYRVIFRPETLIPNLDYS